MTPSRVRRVLLGLALLDLVVFGGWIAREDLARRWGTEVLLPVEGYDPRDLLSGHYVRLRLVAAREAAALDGYGLKSSAEPEPAVSYCLERRSDGRHHVHARREGGDDCRPFITGRAGPAAIDFGVDRFYVDERRQNEVVTGPADAETYLRARIDGGGQIHPVDLVIGGRSLRGR